MKYKIADIEPTGEEHDTFGREFEVELEGEGLFNMWFKKPPKTGDTIEGTISNGRFKKTKPAFVGGGSKPKGSFGARDDAMIKAQWSINAAIALAQVRKEEPSLPGIEEVAAELFHMAGRVKNSIDTQMDDEEVEEAKSLFS